jgi:hypothetical protein
MAASLCVAITAVSTVKFDTVDSGEVGRSAVYRSHSSDPRTVPWGASTFAGTSSMCSFST